MSNAIHSRHANPRLGASLAVIAFSLAAASAAQAQDAPAATPDSETQVEELVITGFRGSLASALATKRNETGVVDVIKAEDIADFPDLNLAEAIQRIPGVSIDRDAGEGRSITVRGLGSDFTRIRINGIQALATTGGTDSSGGANRGRQFDFNIFASELFNSITVRKTQAAEVEEGSLGATVDLRTSRPFDFKGRVLTFAGQYGYNDLAEEWDPRGALMYSNQTQDGTWGVLVSLAYSQRNLLEEGFSSVRWADAASSSGFQSCAAGTTDLCTSPQRSSLYHPRLPRYGRLTHSQDRLGATFSLQFRPSDATTVSLDVLYADLQSTRQEDFLESLSFSRSGSRGKGATDVLAAEVASDGDIVYGLFNDVDVRSESRFDDLETKFTQYTLDVQHRFNDQWSGGFVAGRAESIFRNPFQTTVTLDHLDADGYSWDFRGNDREPAIDYGFDVTDPANWQWINSPPAGATGSEIRIRPQGVDNVYTTLRFDLTYDLNEVWTLKGGLNWAEFQFDSFEKRRSSETSVPALPGGTTVADISRLLTGFNSGGLHRSWLIPNLNVIARTFDIYCNCDTGVPGGNFTLFGETNGSARGNNRSAEEIASSAYLQAQFRSELWGMPMRGDLGLRYVKTEVEATGFLATGGGTKVTVGNEYSDVLPSLNLAVDLTEDLKLRFGAAKVMARPQLPSLSPGGTVNTAALTITTGNPVLDPFQAKTYDLGLEWYFAKDSLLSFALFYKDIDTYIQTVRESRAFGTTGLPLSLLPPGQDADTVYAITSPINTDGGPLKGFEISYQQPFTFLPAPLDRFGAVLNYTYVQSEIEYATSATSGVTVTDDLVNLSPKAYNATLYYEDERFSARVSASYRDDYLQTVPGRNSSTVAGATNTNDVEGKRETFNVDASASFKVDDSLSLTFEGLNLTDEYNDQYISSTADRSSVYHHTGRQFYFGLRYTF
ncbi:MAG: TonB-dependent receptor [Caulobacter sp.]|nr:TonB-dependent receptor [Caulobacter sp.]